MRSTAKRTTVFERSAAAPAAVEVALRDTKPAPYWLDDIGAGTRYEQLFGAVEADLAVVGGGYCGLWTAVQAKLDNPGAKVVLVESQTVGWAASGRNGGFCEASLTHGRLNGESRWPEEIDELDRLGMENLDEIEKAVRDHGLDCEFERTGSLEVAVEPYQVDELRAEPGTPDSPYLDQDAIRAQVNSPTYLAGRWHKNTCALVHPAKLATELARLATGLGVQIFEHSHVDSLDADPGSAVLLRTPLGRVRAKQVALATNVFPSLLRKTRLHTVPVYDYALMTEPLSAEQLAQVGWSQRQGIADMANQFHYYRMTADNRILFGGYDAVYHFGRKIKAAYEDRPQSYRRLASHFLTTFPQLEGVRFSHKWAGAIDTSTRFCAYYGTAKGGRVAYAAGFTGLGVAATRFAARVMLDQLSGQTTELTKLQMVRSTPLPFPPEPLAALGIQATRWSLDRADHNEGKRNLLLRGLDAIGLGFES
jgi:glycine/D-amino acid oxidase-like deaminating enzyme